MFVIVKTLLLTMVNFVALMSDSYITILMISTVTLIEGAKFE